MARNLFWEQRKKLRDAVQPYTPLLWRFPAVRKNFIQVAWRSPLLIIKWLLIIAAIIIAPFLLLKAILWGYSFPFTGFNQHPVPDSNHYQPAKSLWDWLQLLGIPAVLAGGAAVFNHLLDARSRDIATDQQRETAMQNYLDEMSKLLTDNHLRESPSEPEARDIAWAARDIARARTLTVLPGLDPIRKGRVLRFLYETGLIFRDNPIVDLRGANFSNLRISETKLNSKYLERTGARISLRKAHLQGAIFRDASLEEVDLRDACLDGAYITYADLSGTWLCNASMKMARLHGSNLYQACLQGAHMEGANLRGAYLREADLRNVHLQEMNGQKANLQAANLRKVHLNETQLQGANLEYADLRGTDLTVLTAEQIKTTNFQGARLCAANITEKQYQFFLEAKILHCRATTQTPFDLPEETDIHNHNCKV